MQAALWLAPPVMQMRSWSGFTPKCAPSHSARAPRRPGSPSSGPYCSAGVEMAGSARTRWAAPESIPAGSTSGEGQPRSKLMRLLEDVDMMVVMNLERTAGLRRVNSIDHQVRIVYLEGVIYVDYDKADRCLGMDDKALRVEWMRQPYKRLHLSIE